MDVAYVIANEAKKEECWINVYKKKNGYFYAFEWATREEAEVFGKLNGVLYRIHVILK